MNVSRNFIGRSSRKLNQILVRISFSVSMSINLIKQTFWSWKGGQEEKFGLEKKQIVYFLFFKVLHHFYACFTFFVFFFFKHRSLLKKACAHIFRENIKKLPAALRIFFDNENKASFVLFSYKRRMMSSPKSFSQPARMKKRKMGKRQKFVATSACWV